MATYCPIDNTKFGLFSGSWELKDGKICGKCGEKAGFDLSNYGSIFAAKTYTVDDIIELIANNGKVDNTRKISVDEEVTAEQTRINEIKQKATEQVLAAGEYKVEIKLPEHVILSADENGITINRLGITSFVNRGKTGSQNIPYQSITSVEFNSGTVGNGQITFHTLGGNDKNSGLGSAPGYNGGVYNNNNAVVFNPAYSNDVELIKKLTEKKMGFWNNNQQPIANNTSSNADEIRKFKGLLDDGIISQEEFDAKKKQLLGL